MVGDIYLATIVFTDASAAKARPILLLKQNSFNDWLYLPLTSNLFTTGIKITSSDLKEGYLPKDSIAVHEKISVIAATLLVRKIATINNDSLQMVIQKLIVFIQH